MSIKANQNQSELIRALFDEARHLIEQEDHECAVKMLQNCLNLGPEPCQESNSNQPSSDLS